MLLAAGLLLFGLLFRQLATLMLAVLVTIVIAIPLSSAATYWSAGTCPAPSGCSWPCSAASPSSRW